MKTDTIAAIATALSDSGIASFIRIHGFQRNGTLCSFHLVRNIFCKIFKGFFSSLPVIFRIHLNTDIIFFFLIDESYVSAEVKRLGLQIKFMFLKTGKNI